MTAALNPSTWYTWLQTYKAGHPERGTELAALAGVYLAAHAEHISNLLSGDPTTITVVPSTQGRTYDSQPLRRALARVTQIVPLLKETLRHVGGRPVGRRSFVPSAFEPGPTRVRGARVILIEDTWVTGGKALSAAGALLSLGAKSIAILPIARLVDLGYWKKDHPYCEAIARPYDLNAWPR